MFCKTQHKRLAQNQTGKKLNCASIYGNRASDWCDPPTGSPKYLAFLFSGIEPPK